MALPVVEIQSRFVNAVRTQAPYKSQYRVADALACPYCGHQGRVFQNIERLIAHTKGEHPSELAGLGEEEAKHRIRDKVNQARRLASTNALVQDQTRAPDIADLSPKPVKECQSSRPSGKTLRADFELSARRGTTSTPVKIADPDNSRDVPKWQESRGKPHNARLYNPRYGNKGTSSPRRSSTETKNESSHVISPANRRQSGLIELHKYDSPCPGLLLQPDSRPISQEQLASEVKGIYAGLTMVETKCIHVDRAQAAAPKDTQEGELAPDHWQALIALHRTLLHEHHDFFLASQHPKPNPALRRLAAKYAMPARMWKHGIHSFLGLLRQRMPQSLDYMLAFIYLAYQMMALLYETVPAFENTWIECLGDLGRCRTAIEDEDVKDREMWANVARSWYTKAADRNPSVGRLYHHLAILARPNALQQFYDCGRSLVRVEPFPTAQESIMTLCRSSLADGPPETNAPIDCAFILCHASLFTRHSKLDYERASGDYLESLDNHIGRVTAKWKESGDYIAVSNIAAWFDYGVDFDRLRRLFLLRASRRAIALQDESKLSTSSYADGRGQSYPTEDKIKKDTAAPVHVVSTFFSTPMSFSYTSRTVRDVLWADLINLLNAMVKSEEPKTSSLASNGITLFPSIGEEDHDDELPLPEGYLVRGLVQTAEHLSTQWFSGANRVRNNLSGKILGGCSKALKLGYMLPVASLPKVYAYDATLLAPGLLLRKAEVFDYVGYGLMFPCMGLLWWLGSKTTELSFTVTLLSAFLWFVATSTSSLLEIRTTIIQIWTVFNFNYVARDCSEATHPRPHLLKYTVLSALFAFFGTAIQSTQDDKVLRVIPPAVALASVVLSFIPKDNRAHNLQTRDEERALPHQPLELERVVVARD